MAKEPKHVAETYFSAWRDKDFETFRALLAEDVTFRGPLGADDCVAGIEGMSKIVTDTSVAPPAATANWSHVENGRITSIRVTFDARPLAPPPDEARLR